MATTLQHRSTSCFCYGAALLSGLSTSSLSYGGVVSLGRFGRKSDMWPHTRRAHPLPAIPPDSPAVPPYHVVLCNLTVSAVVTPRQVNHSRYAACGGSSRRQLIHQPLIKITDRRLHSNLLDARNACANAPAASDSSSHHRRLENVLPHPPWNWRAHVTLMIAINKGKAAVLTHHL